MTQRNLSMKQKQTHRHRDQISDCQHGEWGWRAGRDGLGIWGWWMLNITFRMDKQQGPTV